MKKKSVLVFFVLVCVFSLLTSNIIADITEISPHDHSRKLYAYRENNGVFINLVDRNASVRDSLDKEVRFKWGYNQEFISSSKIATKDKPNNMVFPFWFLHYFDSEIDACNGELDFFTSYPTDLEILWDYNMVIENHGHDVNSAVCIAPYDIDQCFIEGLEGEELRLCDVALKDSVCIWNTTYFDGTYSYVPISGWTPLNELSSCVLESGRVYEFRHTASMPAGSNVKFDVNAVVRQVDSRTASQADSVIFSIDPTWTSTAPSDFNTGTGFDFNWTKVTSDGNVMPTGSDKVYVEQDQTFYDNNLVIYYKFDDLNATGGVVDDTNNDFDGRLDSSSPGTGTIKGRGLWDGNSFKSTSAGNAVASHYNPDDVNEFTVTFWYNTTTLVGTKYFADTSDGATGIGIRVSTELFQFFTYCGGDTGLITSTATEEIGQWIYLAFVHSADNKIYVDGMIETDGAVYCPGGGMDAASKNLVVGAEFDTTTGGIIGFMDEFKFYDRVLTPDEIQQDYNAWMTAKYYSPIKDAGAAADWDDMKWYEDSDVNNHITVDYRGCQTSDCSSAGEWQTPLEGGNTTHSTITADGNQYFQYRANLDTNKQMWNKLIGGDTKGEFARLNTMVINYTIGNAFTLDNVDDFNTGNAFDFNWSRVNLDANVTPFGGDRVYYDQNRLFFDNNLLIYYRFDENLGSTIIDDTNNGYDGTIYGDGDIESIGMWDSNAYFSGANGDGIDTDLNMDDINEFTITLWVKPYDFVPAYFLADTSDGSKGFNLKMSSGAEFLAYCGGDTGLINTGTDDFENGKWSYVAAVHSSRNYLYIDGVLETTSGLYCSTGGIDDVDVNMWIGSEFDNTDGMIGLMDEFKFYDRVLTPDEILQDYQSWMKADYFSPVLDASSNANWSTITWADSVDRNNSLSVEYRGCTNNDCTSAGDWQTPLYGGGIEHSSLTADNNQYFQWKVQFDTNKTSWNRFPETDDNTMFARISNVIVTFEEAAADSCSCPASGNWGINDGSVCTLSILCNITGDLHISNGSLNITSTGTLNIPTGKKAIIDTAQKLYIEKGGQLVVHK